MYEIWSTAGLIWSPRIRSDRAVTAATMELELNRAGRLTFTLAPGHPCAELMLKLSTECFVLRDGSEIFRGRVLYSDRDFRNRREIVCEGLRNTLNDEVLRPEDLSSDGTYSGTAAGLIDKICAAYNSRRPGGVQFARGTVDDLGTVEAKAENYPKLGEFLDGVIEQAGGYLSVRRQLGENVGENVIDWRAASGSQGGQVIRFGSNLLDLKEHVTGEEIFTVVVPIGKDGLTIVGAAHGDGTDRIENAQAIGALGVRIARVVQFNEIEDADELYAAGAAVFSEGGGVVSGLELTAADLHDAGVNVDRIDLGMTYRVYSPPHGLDMTVPVSKMQLNLLRPEATPVTFGITTRGLSEGTARTAAKAEAAVQTAKAAQATADAATPASRTDYVVENGSNAAGWRWRKWDSGALDVWGARISTTLGTWSAYTTGWDVATMTIALPSSLLYDSNFTASVNVSRGSGGQTALLGAERITGTSQIDVIAVKPSEKTITALLADVSIRGRWKQEVIA